MSIESLDMLSIYERQDEAARAEVCPVCRVAYKSMARHGRVIQLITGPDTWDTFPCPGCRPDEFPASAARQGNDKLWIDRLLAHAARDRAAGRRLTDAEHRAAEQTERTAASV
jgi:hypothetical protein